MLLFYCSSYCSYYNMARLLCLSYASSGLCHLYLCDFACSIVMRSQVFADKWARGMFPESLQKEVSAGAWSMIHIRVLLSLQQHTFQTMTKQLIYDSWAAWPECCLMIWGCAACLSKAYVHVHIRTAIRAPGSCAATPRGRWLKKPARSISEISSCFFGPRPWHIEIRHRVQNTSTISLFGFESLKLKIRRLKLWKPTARRLPDGAGTNRVFTKGPYFFRLK